MNKHILAKKPVVTVIMSAYNHEKYVGQAIESVLSQTYQNFKFIVSDDCSTDATRDEILKYEDQIDEIHFYDVNSGTGRYKEYIDSIDTEYIALINSDDYWEKDKLEKQINYMNEQPECGVCFTGTRIIDENGNEYSESWFCEENMSDRERMLYFFFYRNNICHPSKLIRTDIEKRLVSEFDFTPFRQAPDFYMWLILIQRCELHVYPEKLVNFRVRSENQNVSAPSFENNLRTMFECSYIWRKIFEEMSDENFVKFFSPLMVDKETTDHEELLCERYFVLAQSKRPEIQHSANEFFYDIASNPVVYSIFENKYNFRATDFYSDVMKTGYLDWINKQVEQSNTLLKAARFYQSVEEQGFDCPFCNKKRIMLPLNEMYWKKRIQYGGRKGIDETLNKYAYTCPYCGSLDRDRLIALYLLKEQFFEKNDVSVLHIAPSVALDRWISGLASQYHTLDLFMENVTYRCDIQDMKEINDSSYDLWICSHVLEHVKDDICALKELRRVLKPNGVGILLVPIDLSNKETDEEWGLSTEENWRRFGQDDHSRLYSKKDFLKRIEESGFTVFEANEGYFGEETFLMHGFTDTSTLYILRKSGM